MNTRSQSTGPSTVISIGGFDPALPAAQSNFLNENPNDEAEYPSQSMSRNVPIILNYGSHSSQHMAELLAQEDKDIGSLEGNITSPHNSNANYPVLRNFTSENYGFLGNDNYARQALIDKAIQAKSNLIKRYKLRQTL